MPKRSTARRQPRCPCATRRMSSVTPLQKMQGRRVLCVLFAAAGLSSVAHGSSCGTGDFLQGLCFPDHDIITGGVSASDAAACCSMCSSKSACKAWTYNNASGSGLCFLKDEVPESKQKDTCISGRVDTHHSKRGVNQAAQVLCTDLTEGLPSVSWFYGTVSRFDYTFVPSASDPYRVPSPLSHHAIRLGENQGFVLQEWLRHGRGNLTPRHRVCAAVLDILHPQRRDKRHEYHSCEWIQIRNWV